MQGKPVHLVAGLGNPGDAYRMTRHNAGFMVVDQLAEAFQIRLNKRKFDSVFGRGRIRGQSVILTKPLAYMNRSGPPVRRLADYFGISGKALIIVHDDIDLAFGRIKIKEKGGDGGHKGVRSLIDTLGDGGFVRVRIGVGRGTGNRPTDGVVDHVLGRFDSEEITVLNRIITTARQAVVAILCQGAQAAMNSFNSKPNFIHANQQMEEKYGNRIE